EPSFGILLCRFEHDCAAHRRDELVRARQLERRVTLLGTSKPFDLFVRPEPRQVIGRLIGGELFAGRRTRHAVSQRTVARRARPDPKLPAERRFEPACALDWHETRSTLELFDDAVSPR